MVSLIAVAHEFFVPLMRFDCCWVLIYARYFTKACERGVIIMLSSGLAYPGSYIVMLSGPGDV